MNVSNFLKKDSLIKLNSIFAVGLAIVFLLFFQFTKHDPVLSAIIPFGNDPYDAVGSLGVVIAGLLSALSVIRAFRRKHTERQKILIARTQFTVAATVFVTLTADGVAMVRHIPLWFGHPGAVELLGLMISMLILVLLLSFSIRFSIRDLHLEAGSWRKVTIIFIIAILILALYPEFIIQSTVGELFTLFAGILLLFIPLSVLPGAFIPFNVESFDSSETRSCQMRTRLELVVVALLGVGIGIILLIGEWNGEGAPVPGLRILLASIFIGVPLVSLLIAYYCLRKPLALFCY